MKHETLVIRSLDWVHCEEEIGAYAQLSRNTYKLVIFFLIHFLKFILQKNMRISKNSIKSIIHFFLTKRDNWT